jgi:quinoprotein glucose dehydrogenase
MSPVGDGPRDHPLLKGLNLTPLGERLQGINVLVTKTLVFVGVIPIATPQPVNAASVQKLLYVFDKDSGAPLHAVEIDAFSAAAPMTYMFRGKQYLVVATGSGPTTELIALSLQTPAAN